METTVDTPRGRLRGRRTESALSFLGIPFARAPRFAPPETVAPWDGVRDAVRRGAAAPQPSRPVSEFAHGEPPEIDERCLNLNVYTPSLEGPRPVLVWIHGGGFAMGHAGASVYHGARLAAAADVVVVTANYRLGSLGWLFHPELRAGEGAPAGNWGLLDQIAALRWVRESIAAFGGDPGRVTLAGQSAGALCALDLLTAPDAPGLFQRAIVQSPPFADLALAPEKARRWAEALSELARGREPSGGGFDAALLRSLPVERIVTLHEQLLAQPAFRGTRGGALPTLDAGSLPHSPLQDPGASPAVDILLGWNADEGTFFVNAPWRPPPGAIGEVVTHLTGAVSPSETIERYRASARAQGHPDDDLSLLIEIATDAVVALPAARWAAMRARAVSSAGGHVYRYRVDHPGAGPQLGATHTAEVPLLFQTWDDGGPGERLGGQAPGAAEVSRELVAAWARFIHGDGPGWEALGERTAAVGVFGGASPFRVERSSLGATT